MEFGQRPRLSTAPSARKWLLQFQSADQGAAARLVDALLLLNAEDVSAELRKQLARLAASRTGPRRKAALYAEREFAERAIFQSGPALGRDGKAIKARAFGNTGPSAVKPIRGRVRVGSEGEAAFVISQAVEAAKGNRLLNQPGPDRIRRHKVGLIVIVTDFIGTGSRVRAMLDKFMATPSVRAWRSNRWMEFAVVAAVGTDQGIRAARAHRTRPDVFVSHVAPTLRTYPNATIASGWFGLTLNYGPRQARGSGPQGFQDGGALVAFSYRTPNNTPLLLHQGGGGWTPLFDGPIADDMRQAFGLQSAGIRARTGADAIGAPVADDVLPGEARTILVLRAIRGRWRPGQEIELAERTGLSVPEINDARASALQRGLLTTEGRLTEDGQRLVHDGAEVRRRAPEIPTAELSYYPHALRALR